MSRSATAEDKRARAQEVDEEYKKLERLHIDRQKIVLVDDDPDHEGGYGIVRKAELRQSTIPAWMPSRLHGPTQVVAVKQIKISAASNMLRAKRAFTREMLVWSSLEAHPGIARFLGFYANFKRSEAWLLSPWEPNGNIREFIQAHNLEVPEKLSLAYDTIDALTFLHQLDPPVCHGDIKSANVLVSAKFKAILCDFGLARLQESSGVGRLETTTGFKGSIRWCSPEILNGAIREPSSDVYAWAWLVWEIMTGELPYEQSSVDYAIIRRIFESPLPQVNGESRLSDCLQAWELMTRCWDVEPQNRPTAKMCKTTITYLPLCAPTPPDTGLRTRSAALLENLGDLESWKGNIEKSSAYLDEALWLYNVESDTKGIASVLRKQAAAAYLDSDFGIAVARATTALEHYRARKDTLGIADASSWLGDSLTMQDRRDEALLVLRDSLRIYRMHEHNVGVARCLERIGDIHRCTGQTHEALSTLQEAVAVASREGDRLGEARALRTLAETHYDLSEFVKAADVCSEAITIARKIGWEVGLTDSLRIMGQIKTQPGNYPEAEEFFQEAISISRGRSRGYQLAVGLWELGYCFQEQSKLDEAATVFEESCRLLQGMSLHGPAKCVASTLVELKSSQGDWNSALSWQDHVLALCHSSKEDRELADHLTRRTDILAKAQRHDEGA